MLGAVLGWKFNHAPGISTKEDEDGNFILTAWPDALGSRPTTAEIATYTLEYQQAQLDDQAASDLRVQGMKTRLGLNDDEWEELKLALR